MRASLALLLLSIFATSLTGVQQASTVDANVSQTTHCATAPIASSATSNATPIPTPTVSSIPACSPAASSSAASSIEVESHTLVAGTRIAVTIMHAISTRTARKNDPVYAQTSFPVVWNNRIVIPVGTYVQGVIERSRRASRIKGRGELVIHFNALIFASGYTLPIPGMIDRVPGSERTDVKDAGIVAAGAGIGAALGGLAAHSGGAADIGGLLGAGVGLATILMSRGPDARIERGTLVEMVLERPIVVERERVAGN